MVLGKTATRRRALFEDKAFAQVDSLYSAALRLTRNRQHADDLGQDPLQQAYRHFHGDKLNYNFKKQLFTILLSSYFTKFHDDSATPVVPLLQLEQKIDRAVQQKELKYWLIDNDVLAAPFHDQIMCAIDTMPVDYRIAILLNDIENFTYPEIGGLPHILTTEVGLRIYAGRKILQKSLLDFIAQKSINERNLES